MKKKDKSIDIEKKESSKRSLASFFIVFVLFLVLTYIYAHYMGTKGIKIKEYNVINENIPTSFDGISIIQFSDLELGTTFSIEDLEELVDKINSYEPDIVVFTGDIVHPGHSLSGEETDKVGTLFKKIDALLGKYAVRGDDDQYDGVFDEVMSKSDFINVSNSYELIYHKGLTPIVLYGLDSLNAGAQDFEKTFSYPNGSEDVTYMATYRILLAHEPDTLDLIDDYNISLMLSGHSHNSELNIPYIRDLYNIKGASNYYNEHYKVGSTELYISSGLGTSKYQVRLFSKPSISIFRLYTD